MKTGMMWVLVLVFGLLSSGCAQYWYQEGVSYEQCKKDRSDCFEQLKKRTDFVRTGNYEFEFMTQCMEEKGYRLVKESELPMDVKRTSPDTSLHWRTKGISGTVD